MIAEVSPAEKLQSTFDCRRSTTPTRKNTNTQTDPVTFIAHAHGLATPIITQTQLAGGAFAIPVRLLPEALL